MVPYTSPSFLFIDATGAEKGKRRFTRGAVGCGGRSICGVLENRDKFVKIMLAEEFLESKQALPYDHLLISGMSMDKIAIQRVIKKWRKNHSGKIVLGGPITSDINSILNELPADLIVIGEGEYT
ncbi:MAG: hypothetical protein U9O98_02170, partial [Asgard group archaeon]|nr:hypothetical protein [Asgard group archaeon]